VGKYTLEGGEEKGRRERRRGGLHFE